MHPKFYEVPVHRLMCRDVRMHQILTEPRPLHYKEMKLFLNLLAEVVDRWYQAVSPMNPEIAASQESHETLVRELRSSYLKVMEDDTEEVFMERERLDYLFHRFGEMLQSFASVFASPFELITFYRDILRRLEMTHDIMLEGKHGW
tara:strand:+ start:1203 stop:1640 length:438 start_codon:yes stop_codon:yes gene_type:complete